MLAIFFKKKNEKIAVQESCDPSGARTFGIPDGYGNVFGLPMPAGGHISDIHIVIFGETGQVFLQRRAGMR